MTALYLRPDADSSDGNWKTETGGTTLFSSIDETSASSSDFIVSGINPVADVCKIGLSNPASGVTGPGVLNYEYFKAGTGTVNLIVRLKQGAATITTFTHNNISATPTTANSSIPAPDFANITDFNDLYIEFQADYVAYAGPGDIVGSASHFWGLRAYSAATIGANAVQLRRSSDSGTLDVATGSNGGLDLVAAGYTAWAGADTIRVRTLYDQIGTAHLVQTNILHQPLFILSGIGSLPVMRATSAGGEFLPGTISSISQPYTVSVISKRTGSFTTECGITGNATGGAISYTSSANTMRLYAGSNSAGVTASDSTWHALQGVFSGASSDLNVDGSINTVNPSTGATGTDMDLFVWSGVTGTLDGDIAESGLWPVAFSGANSTAMSANQHAYWGF